MSEAELEAFMKITRTHLFIESTNIIDRNITADEDGNSDEE
jgi:hypothetical protein